LKRSNRLILLIGVFLAVVAFVLIVILLGSGPNRGGPGETPAPSPISTVIAAQDIPLGATITEAMLNELKREGNEQALRELVASNGNCAPL